MANNCSFFVKQLPVGGAFFVTGSYLEILCQPNRLQESNLDCWCEKSMKRIISNVGISRKLTFALFSKVKENKGSENPATASLSPQEHPEIKMVCFRCL